LKSKLTESHNAGLKKQAARVVNTVLVATCWELGRRIIEFEQGGKERAGDGTRDERSNATRHLL